MAGVQRQAHTLWEGPLMGGKGDTEFASSGIGRFPVTWAARTQSPEGKTSPEEMLAAAHATCYAMAFSHALAQAGNAPERLHVTSTVTFAPRSWKRSLTCLASRRSSSSSASRTLPCSSRSTSGMTFCRSSWCRRRAR